jgi:transposase InsO family protein
MPWNKTDPVNERMKFVVELQKGDLSMVAACRQFGISRKTGYKILERHAELGLEGLRDQPRAPRSHPNQVSLAVETAILRLRKAHPTWGSKKLLAVLDRKEPEAAWPARSTVDAILKRAGVVTPRAPHRRRQPSGPPAVVANAPNDVWSIDFKGWFRLGNGVRCDPLTVNDVFSRASLVCQAMFGPKLEDVQRRLESAFWSFGLPLMMLSDNGPPFGSTGLGRLSRLGVWLLRLGVQPVLIEPGRPDQNGRHERFHETLKAETASPPRFNGGAQQASFTGFQVEYNEERPHEALGMKVPAELYDYSPRQMPVRLPEFEYPTTFEVRRVRPDGTMKWSGTTVFVGEAMARENVGIELVDDEVWHLHLGSMRLGVVHARSRTVIPTPFVVPAASVTHVPGHENP